MLTDEQKSQAVLIAQVGCDRETVAKYLGCGQDDLLGAMRRDPAFAVELRRAEAACELAHMRNLQQAGRDPRQWRASVWWLERRSPERFAKRDAGAVGRRELTRFLREVAAGIAAAVRSEDDRQRVLIELTRLGEAASDPLLLAGEAHDPEDSTVTD